MPTYEEDFEKRLKAAKLDAQIRAELAKSSQNSQPQVANEPEKPFLSNAASSGSKFFGGMLGGMYQLARHPAETMTDVADLALTAGAGELRKMLPESVNRQLDRTNEYWGLGAPDQGKQEEAMATRLNEYVGRYHPSRIGQTLYTDPFGAAADISTVLSGGAGLAGKVGALPLATGNVGKAANISKNLLEKAATVSNPLTLPVAAINNVGLPIAGKTAAGITAIARSGANLLFPERMVNKVWLEAAGENPELVASTLEKAKPIVPGSIPTAAQAATGLNIPDFAELGQQSRRVLPNAFYQRDLLQKQAQLESLATIGSKVPDYLNISKEAWKAMPPEKRLQIASDYRNQQATLNYAPAKSETMPFQEADTKGKLVTDPNFEAAETDAFKKALAKAETIASNKGEPLFADTKNSAGKVIRRDLTGEGIQNIKFGFDALLETNPQNPLSRAEEDAVMTAKQKFLGHVEEHIPQFKVASEAYQAQSPIINQANVALGLREKLLPGLEAADLNIPAFAKTLKNQKEFIGGATGTKATSLNEIVPFKQRAGYLRVLKEFERNKALEGQVKAGDLAGKNIKKLATTQTQSADLPPFLTPVVTTTRKVLKRAKGELDEKLSKQVAEAMLNAPDAAASLRKAMEFEKNRMPPIKTLKKTKAFLADQYQNKNMQNLISAISDPLNAPSIYPLISTAEGQ